MYLVVSIRLSVRVFVSALMAELFDIFGMGVDLVLE